MKILLTGSTGMLGTAILNQANNLNIEVIPLEYKLILTFSEQELIRNISHFDLVIHAAANTNVEKCELDPDSCYRDNYLITEIIARASSKANVGLVFISSTGVYGISKSIPYKEYDEAHPTTHHHRSKLMAEKSVMQLNPQNLVVRTGWLFGGNRYNLKNFVVRRIEEAKELSLTTNIIYSDSDQKGVPCYVEDIATRIFDLIQKKLSGIFNCVNDGTASRYEYVKAIIEFASININIEPANSTAFNRKANVSYNEMAENWKMQALGFSKMPHWKESLSSYISQLSSEERV